MKKIILPGAIILVMFLLEYKATSCAGATKKSESERTDNKVLL